MGISPCGIEYFSLYPNHNNTGDGISLNSSELMHNISMIPTDHAVGYFVKQTLDEGFIAIGLVSPNSVIVKMDSFGNLQWSKHFAERFISLGLTNDSNCHWRISIQTCKNKSARKLEMVEML
jgi:hypothetical protein